MKPVLLVTMCVLLAACGAQPVQLQLADHVTPPAVSVREVPVFGYARFGEPPDIISPEEIFRLSSEQQADFMAYFNRPTRRDTPAFERVYSYLQDITMDFHYQGETFTAEQALSNTSGNCLSLAILTTALAKLADVETGYQLVDTAPVFESHGNIVYKGQHVRTKLFPPVAEDTEGLFFVRRSGVLIDYFPTEGTRFVGNISENEYIAMFYNNLASEAIAREDYERAFWLLVKTLELTPDDPGALNSMAVIHRRVGDVEAAEQIYLYGIAYLDDKVSLLRNYRVLLEQQGRHDEVTDINRKLAQIEAPNPFDWMHAGHAAFSEGDFQDALRFYRKAAKIAPYLHESYAGMAKAYYMIGDHKGAEMAFQNAVERSQRLSTRSMYEAKLVALSRVP